MLFEFDNNIPIYIQLVEQITINIISGGLAPGERLPSVRDLAFDTKVNPNTMQKALAELEEMGLIFTERTNGKFVTTDVNLIEQIRKEYADMQTRRYLKNMSRLGFDVSATVEYIDKTEGEQNVSA